MTEDGWPESPYQILIRMLIERYPDEVAAELRELGYQVGEPAGGAPDVDETPLGPEQTESVLNIVLDLLEESGAESVDVHLRMPPA